MISTMPARLRNEAVASEELNPGDSDIATMREAADEIERLTTLLNTPLFDDFTEAVKLEAAHQIERWGTAHDRAKEPQDWYWLLGYLSGKCLRSHIEGDRQKALHHTISSAAALLNWHAAISGADTRMQPGSSDIQKIVEASFGPDAAMSDSAPISGDEK